MVRLRGLVQGVGMRPAVWRLARECGISGDVRNDGDGVLVRAWGSRTARRRFIARLRAEAPPLARLEAVDVTPLPDPAPGRGFHILGSENGAPRTGIIPDAATCPACRAEIFDAADRRFGYAFANCTHCGPRLSIVQRIPYDRARTSMARFPLCPRCRQEYADPADRRYHAQPIACPTCGPGLWLEPPPPAADGDPIATACARLRCGRILAIKGLGGFQLAVDAADAAAIARLRGRKRRPRKPFALMARDLAQIRRYCSVDEHERALLESPAAPIVLLEADGPERLPAAVAPGQRCLGFMLPCTPLHHLLLAGLEHPIVLTSGNPSQAPPCIDNAAARTTLAGVADDWLLHDRDIVTRLDDSVARVVAGAPRLLRRARGYAPAPLPLPPGLAAAPPLLALGGEQKSSFCLLRDGQAVLSQHLGDLDKAETFADYRRTLAHYQRLFGHRPRLLVIDRHPDYRSSTLGRELAQAQGLPLLQVQHHHAHLAACLAESGRPLEAPPVLGVALDGLGLGEDGGLWGGEFLRVDYRGFAHLAQLKPVPLPGAAAAVREPWRNAYAQIRAALGWSRFLRDYGQLELADALCRRPVATLEAMLAKGLNSPPSSSCGRLFDAVAAAVGLCRERISYEGQAAMELEAQVDAGALEAAGAGYPLQVLPGRPQMLDTAPMWPALLEDLAARRPTALIAARFHLGLARAVVELAATLARREGLDTVALSGGVFQNRILFGAVSEGLRGRGLGVLAHRQVPANDGGLALGQAAVAAARALAPPQAGAAPAAWNSPVQRGSPCV